MMEAKTAPVSECCPKNLTCKLEVVRLIIESVFYTTEKIRRM